MPKQTTTTSIAKKLGNRLTNAVKAAADDDSTYGGFAPLPAGVSGIAKLVDIQFGVYKQGDYTGKDYARLSAVVVSPDSHNGVPIKGQQTSVMHPLCDTKNGHGEVTTFDDNVRNFMKRLRSLGAKTAGIADPEPLCDALKEAKPHFRFWTSQGSSSGINPKTKQPYPPKVFENWGSAEGLENYSSDVTPDVQDETHESNGQASDTTEEVTDETTTETGDDDGLDALVEKANNDDMKAKKALISQAAMFDISAQECEDATSWEAVAGWIREKHAAAGEGETTEETTEDDTPKVGDVYRFQPTDPATKKPMVKNKKPVFVEVELLEINGDKCKLKNNVDKKTVYNGVKLDRLQPV